MTIKIRMTLEMARLMSFFGFSFPAQDGKLRKIYFRGKRLV